VKIINIELAMTLSSIVLLLLCIPVIFVTYKLKARKLDLIERGVWRAEYETRGPEIPIVGIILSAFGVAIVAGVFCSSELDINLRAIAGFSPLFVGVSLLLYHFAQNLTQKEETKNEG
jgi:hypothetical protein